MSDTERHSWYSVRCIFRASDRPAYEERITLWWADSFESAIRMAEEEASKYAAHIGFEYVDLPQAYDLRSTSLGNGSEVFSLMRTSPLQARDYLDRFFDTGAEAEHKTA